MARTAWVRHRFLAPELAALSTLAVIAAFHFSPALAAQGPGSVSVEPGTDRPGLNYRSYETDGGPGACQNDCAGDVKCQAYTWVRPGVQRPKAVCWLKFGVPGPAGNNDCVSGVKTSLPQGLTGGLSYWIPQEAVHIGTVDGAATLLSGGQRSAKPGWRSFSDGDIVAGTNHGFYHQELLSEGGGITSVSPDRLVLPAGTACGFHHTLNSPPRDGAGTCMGIDPGRDSCPVGWIPRRHFDMGSGDGHADCNSLAGLLSGHCHYFVWCEYMDPSNTCKDPGCLGAAVRTATMGIESNTDQSGATLRPVCPPGTTRTPFFDRGRGSGEGLSFCLNSAPQATPPAPGGLTGAFWFDVQSGVHYAMTVTFNGELEGASGTEGARTFVRTVTAEGTGMGLIPRSVGFTVQGLMPGTWRIGASSNLTGPVTNCPARVPGFVGLSVAGGQGPKCY